ncbi:MAG TPA: hypothetical protein VNH18_24710, partial [Bryobacteraceae bacterium]|nr:hypothetical protein [Bryobacteraceae bacterium]
GIRQARANDRLIGKLDANPELAATHHRKTLPFKPGWESEVQVWPFLLRIEFLAAIIVTLLLLVWSLTINAPLDEPANPGLTMNPAKAPWYFVGLQELLVYFDPWIAGVVLPLLIIVGLLLFPYLDASPLGSGYYTLRQRRVALTAFGAGFAIWIGAIFVGTFIRGPGWMWFWPGQTWDHNRTVYETTRDLPELLGVHNAWGAALIGILAIGLFYAAAGWAIHKLITRSATDRQTYRRTSSLQYLTFQFFAVTILVAVPAKIALRLLFRVKYVLVTHWFNI